jgi:MEDS: MEthanogen/methylotroph, DcmR Sensory domain
MRLDYPTVRAYGEMVDVLWQRGERDAAMRLEEFWNDLAKLQTFSLLCAYYIDNLDGAAYAGPLECVCKVHTHLIPAHDYSLFNAAVIEATKEVLEQPLAEMLLSLSEQHRPQTAMPQGQATLLWLQRNMPRTAAKVLAEVRARSSS